MSNKIDPSVGAAAAPAPVRPVVRSREHAATGANAAPPKSGDSVALTGEAQVMQQLEQRARGESGVDEAKVAEMRRILSQGLYHADPQAIAVRLMQLEHSLSGAS
jgi:flagellar biosynthesis anti-sigma factor FlgM